jgi:hypothetical protein
MPAAASSATTATICGPYVFDDRYAARNPFADLPSPLASIAADGAGCGVFRISPDEPWRVIRTRWRVAGKASGPVEGGGRVSGYSPEPRDDCLSGRTPSAQSSSATLSPATPEGISFIGNGCAKMARAFSGNAPAVKRRRNLSRHSIPGFVRSVSPMRPMGRFTSSICIARSLSTHGAFRNR